MPHFSKKTMPELNRISPEELESAAKSAIIVVLEDVRSMMNVGSVFRTCDAFRVEKLYLCGYTPQPPHRDIHKTALGATDTVNWEYAAEILPLLQELKSKAYRLIAVEQANDSTFLQNYVKSDSIDVLIFGNEVTGVSDEVLSMCDDCLEIPQFGNKHSLNISVSAGVVLWDVYRKRYLVS